jgi:hypothetical protein
MENDYIKNLKCIDAVEVFLYSCDGGVIEYLAETTDRADAEFHIDHYKETFSRRLENGSLHPKSWAVFVWATVNENDEIADSIIDSWNNPL